ncbi:MAG: Xaa-Pro peptidase family protein [Actinomycetota bacterium]|nr:Xaa-Pro peptidase family protein [Actinomycetota bacterium]
MPYTNEGYARFSDAEYERRHNAARDLLERSGTDALVLFGTSSQGGTGQADIYYLSQHMGRQENILLFFPDSDPVLLVTAFNHVPNARRQSVVADTRYAGAKTEFGNMIVQVLKERGVSPKRLGLIGFLPWQAYNQLRNGLPDTETVDLTKEHRMIRLFKSEEEIEWLREGCARTDKAMMAMVNGMRAGMKEYELGFLLADGYRELGGEDYLHYTSSTPMDSPNRAVPSQTPSNRVIRSGDIFSIELSIGYHGYAGQALRTIVLDGEPTQQFLDLYDAADEAYRRMVDTIKPGATTADVLDQMKFIDDRGYAIIDGLLHGYGIGILPPSLPGEGFFATETRPVITPDEPHKPFTFEKGMTVVAQPNVTTKDGTAGVQLGNLIRVTDHGVEVMHDCPLELLRA